MGGNAAEYSFPYETPMLRVTQMPTETDIAKRFCGSSLIIRVDFNRADIAWAD